jgi:hypothetical protein
VNGFDTTLVHRGGETLSGQAHPDNSQP